MKTGKKMLMLRKSRNLTQAKVGELFSIDAATITRYEKGLRQPNAEFISKFAQFFDVSTDYLLDDTDSSWYMAKVNLIGEFVEGNPLSNKENIKLNVFINHGFHPWDCFIIKVLSDYDEFKISKNSLCLVNKDNIDVGTLHIVCDENGNYHLGILDIDNGTLMFNNKKISQNTKIIGKLLSIVFDLNEIQSFSNF